MALLVRVQASERQNERLMTGHRKQETEEEFPEEQAGWDTGCPGGHPIRAKLAPDPHSKSGTQENRQENRDWGQRKGRGYQKVPRMKP